MNLKEATKTVALGLAWLFGAGWFWLHVAGNPIRELLLILRAQTASGQIIDAWEDEGEEGDDGRARWSHGFSYRFALPDGRQITGFSGTRRGRLRSELVDLEQPFPVEVEYDPAYPSTSRVKGEGCQTVSEWLLRRVGVGGILLVLLATPGVKLIWDGLRVLRAAKNLAV